MDFEPNMLNQKMVINSKIDETLITVVEEMFDIKDKKCIDSSK